jgi:NTE family protein
MSPNPTDASSRAPILIDLALQGGGSHGAFTWGVLDRLLEEDWLRVEAISGTSAGAMNAAVLADGWTQGGSTGARAALDAYWRQVSQAAAFSPLQRSPLDRLMGRWTLDTSPIYLAIDMTSRVFSPYTLNPFGLNPLRAILAKSIDFERLARSPVRLFITATSVRTGRGRIFRNSEITPDVLLASACLPTMFQAIEIDGEPYWDGGYAGNPTITPLVRESDAHDTIVVQINPRERPDMPRTASEILNRLNEISFEGNADDRAAAAGRRSGPWRRRALDRDACPSHPDRRTGQVWCVLEAQRGMGVRDDVEGAGTPERGRIPCRAWCGPGNALQHRHRRAATGVLRS